MDAVLCEDVSNTRQCSFTASREMLSPFGDLIGDHNPVHRSADVARSLSLEDTPVFAIFLGAQAEFYLLQNIPPLCKSENLRYSGHSFKFENPVYPGQRIIFSNEGNKLSGRGLELALNAQNADQKKVLDSRALFANAFPVCEIPSESPVYQAQTLVSREHHNKFHALLGNSMVPENISYLQIASFVPAALLEKAFAETKEHKPALSRSLDLKFHSIADFSPVVTEIYLIGARKLGNQGWLYSVKGICYQNQNPVLTAEMKVIHPDKIMG